MQRCYAEIEGRRLHYRRAGSGPPVVMLHGSPGNSEMLEHEIAAAADHFTVFALDTPGFGASDPLPGETLTVGDLACATAAGMRAIGLPPCPLYGTHTGALIALQLGADLPDQVTGLVLEGVPVFTDAEIETLFVGYFEPLAIDPLGGHLTSTWMRFRDQHTWFPWLSRDVTRLNPVDRPTPEEIHHWVMMFYRSHRTYKAAYRAACYHGYRSREAAERLTVPAVYMASTEDMLFPHLDRLPVMNPGQRIERLPYDAAAKYRAIADYLGSLPQASEPPSAPSLKPVGHSPAVQFIRSGTQDIFIRSYGSPEAPALVLLHDAPSSGLALEPLARDLAATHYVIVPDLPGCGESELGEGDPLDAGAKAVTDIADVLDLERFTVAATGCGCAVAAKLADDPRVERLILDSPPSPDPTVAASIAPDLPLTPEGSHWIKAWLMVRDGQIYTPWFDGSIAAQRPTQGNFDGEWLHDQTFEIMKARETYHRLPRAAWAFDTRTALEGSAIPVTLAANGELATTIYSTPNPKDYP